MCFLTHLCVKFCDKHRTGKNWFILHSRLGRHHLLQEEKTRPRGRKWVIASSWLGWDLNPSLIDRKCVLLTTINTVLSEHELSGVNRVGDKLF